MARLIAQTLGVVIASGLVYALLQRAGSRLPFAAAAALTVVALLGVLGVSSARDVWEGLDNQRKLNAAVTPEAGRTSCTAVGVNREYLEWVAARIPVRAKFYMTSPETLGSSAETCIRFLLLPRVQVADLEDVRYVVFWEAVPPDVLAEVKRRGGVVETFGPDLKLARIP